MGWRAWARVATQRAANKLGQVGREVDSRWLFWSVYYPFNFGDWIGPFLYKKMTGRDPWFSVPKNVNRGTVFMSAGSILELARGDTIVWGSGIKNEGANLARPFRICAVRGPYTKARCNALKIECPEVFGDPGILLPRYYSSPNSDAKYALGIVPHFRDLEFVRQYFGWQKDVLIIDVRAAVEVVVDAINSCEKIVSSSLHGLIVANAYGVRSGWVKFGDRLAGDGVKFRDYFASVGCGRPRCLEGDQVFSLDNLKSYAVDSDLYPVERLGDLLLDACPFPKNN